MKISKAYFTYTKHVKSHPRTYERITSTVSIFLSSYTELINLIFTLEQDSQTDVKR